MSTLDETEIAALAAQVHALQDGWTRADEELAVRDLLLAVRGADLTRLKNALNMRTDAHDLEGLLFDDIDDEAIRAEILAHIAAEAETVDPHEAKVLCDIDDTVFPALHEKRYPKGDHPYPGVLAFLQALDDGPDPTPASTGDLTFVTARPEVAFGLVESRTKAALAEAGVASHSLLAGSLLALRSRDSMAGAKLRNIEHYRLLFPEYDLVFVGDSGQGDVIVAERIHRAHPDAVRAAFIHDVQGTPAPERERLRSEGIHVVDTYVGAAVIAHELDLISARGLAQVVAETREGLDAIPWDSTEQEAAARALVARDTPASSAP